MRCDQFFGECFGATTNDIISIEDSFPDNDFFLDISRLYLNDMVEDTDVNPMRI
jgi:hypothetical protein